MKKGAPMTSVRPDGRQIARMRRDTPRGSPTSVSHIAFPEGQASMRTQHNIKEESRQAKKRITPAAGCCAQFFMKSKRTATEAAVPDRASHLLRPRGSLKGLQPLQMQSAAAACTPRGAKAFRFLYHLSFIIWSVPEGRARNDAKNAARPLRVLAANLFTRCGKPSGGTAPRWWCGSSGRRPRS